MFFFLLTKGILSRGVQIVPHDVRGHNSTIFGIGVVGLVRKVVRALTVTMVSTTTYCVVIGFAISMRGARRDLPRAVIGSATSMCGTRCDLRTWLCFFLSRDLLAAAWR